MREALDTYCACDVDYGSLVRVADVPAGGRGRGKAGADMRDIIAQAKCGLVGHGWRSWHPTEWRREMEAWDRRCCVRCGAVEAMAGSVTGWVNVNYDGGHPPGR